MSFGQRLLKLLTTSSYYESVKAESKTWRIECSVCGSGTDMWSLGGIRHHATGDKMTMGHCRSCAKLQKMKIYQPDLHS